MPCTFLCVIIIVKYTNSALIPWLPTIPYLQDWLNFTYFEEKSVQNWGFTTPVANISRLLLLLLNLVKFNPMGFKMTTQSVVGKPNHQSFSPTSKYPKTHMHSKIVVVSGPGGVGAGLPLQRGAGPGLVQLRRGLLQLLLQLFACQARRQSALQDVLAVHLLEVHHFPVWGREWVMSDVSKGSAKQTFVMLVQIS